MWPQEKGYETWIGDENSDNTQHNEDIQTGYKQKFLEKKKTPPTILTYSTLFHRHPTLNCPLLYIMLEQFAARRQQYKKRPSAYFSMQTPKSDTFYQELNNVLCLKRKKKDSFFLCSSIIVMSLDYFQCMFCGFYSSQASCKSRERQRIKKAFIYVLMPINVSNSKAFVIGKERI